MRIPGCIRFLVLPIQYKRAWLRTNSLLVATVFHSLDLFVLLLLLLLPAAAGRVRKLTQYAVIKK